jgi:arsenate reductase/regulatory protein spx
VTVRSRDIFRQPLSPDELRDLAAMASVPGLFSWKSPTARKLGLSPGTRTDGELLGLMAGEPRLIRRPLIVSGDRIIIGADLRALADLG